MGWDWLYIRNRLHFPQQILFRGLGLALHKKQTTRNLTQPILRKHPIILILIEDLPITYRKALSSRFERWDFFEDPHTAELCEVMQCVTRAAVAYLARFAY